MEGRNEEVEIIIQTIPFIHMTWAAVIIGQH